MRDAVGDGAIASVGGGEGDGDGGVGGDGDAVNGEGLPCAKGGIDGGVVSGEGVDLKDERGVAGVAWDGGEVGAGLGDG